MKLFGRIFLSLCVFSFGPNARAETLDTQPPTRNSPTTSTPEGVKVSSFSGSATYSYPIEVPPGTAGMQPNLALVYDSLTGSTEYGRGWSLNLGKIERVTRFGPPRYQVSPDVVNAAADSFEMDGQILVRDPSDPSRFHRRQSDHSRIVYNSTTDAWYVTQPDGTQFLYGSRSATASSKLTNGANGAGPTFRWALDQVIDPRGNSYTVDYLTTLGPDSWITNIYPRTIRYTFHAGAPATQSSRMVFFEWDVRGSIAADYDQPTSYRSGFLVQITKRLSAISTGVDTSVNGTLETSEQVRRYQFTYAPKTTPAASQNPPFSELTTVQRYASNGSSLVAFPTATQFQYTTSERSLRGSPVTPTIGKTWNDPNPTASVRLDVNNDTDSDIRDMNGDGLPDRVWTDAITVNSVVRYRWRVAYGKPDGGFDSNNIVTWSWHCLEVVHDYCEPAISQRISSAQDLAVTGGSPFVPDHWLWVEADLIDMDGDGIPDRVVVDSVGTWHVYKNTGKGEFLHDVQWGRPGPSTSIWTAGSKLRNVSASFLQDSSPNGDGSSSLLRGLATMADVDGDGLPDHLGGDAITSGGTDNWIWYSRNNGSGFDPAVLIPMENAPSSWATFHAPFTKELPMHVTSQNAVDIHETFGACGVDCSKYYGNRGIVDINGDGIPDHIHRAPSYEPSNVAIGAAFGLGKGWQQTNIPTGYSSQYQYRGSPDANTPYYYCGWLLDCNDIPGDTAPTTSRNRVLVDMNGDGILDSVFGEQSQMYAEGSNSGSGGETVELGLGDGHYLPGIIWSDNYWSHSPGTPSHPAREVVPNSNGRTKIKADIIDINGDGLPDRVVSVSAGSLYIFFNPGPPEGLLSRVTSEFGGTTDISYVASTASKNQGIAHSYFHSGLDGYPEETPTLPLSISTSAHASWVLDQVTVHDGRVGTPAMTTTYAYAEPRFDYARRESAGFRMIESQDSVGTIARTIFLQGETLRGQQELSEAVNGTSIFSAATSTYTVAPAQNESGVAVSGSWAISQVDETTSTFGATSAVSQDHRVTTQFDVQTGNKLSTLDLGANQSSTADDYKLTYEYAPNFSSWLVSYPCRITETLGVTQGSKIEMAYDGALGFPDPYCLQPTAGLMLRKRTLRSLAGGTEDWAVEDFRYDSYGNKRLYADPQRNAIGSGPVTATVVYDSAYNTFPQQLLNANPSPNARSVSYRFRPGDGRVTRVLDSNLHLECDDFDALGRATTISESTSASNTIDSSCDSTLVNVTYPNVGDPSAQQIVTTTTVDSLHSMVSFLQYDGLGRTYLKGDNANSWVGSTKLYSLMGYGSRGDCVLISSSHGRVYPNFQ